MIKNKNSFLKKIYKIPPFSNFLQAIKKPQMGPLDYASESIFCLALHHIFLVIKNEIARITHKNENNTADKANLHRRIEYHANTSNSTEQTTHDWSQSE